MDRKSTPDLILSMASRYPFVAVKESISKLSLSNDPLELKGRVIELGISDIEKELENMISNKDVTIIRTPNPELEKTPR